MSISSLFGRRDAPPFKYPFKYKRARLSIDRCTDRPSIVSIYSPYAQPWLSARAFKQTIFGLPASRAHLRPASRNSCSERCRWARPVLVAYWRRSGARPADRRSRAAAAGLYLYLQFQAGNARFRQYFFFCRDQGAKAEAPCPRLHDTPSMWAPQCAVRARGGRHESMTMVSRRATGNQEDLVPRCQRRPLYNT